MKPTVISADVLFEEFRQRLRWSWVAGLEASERVFNEVAVRAARSGADLVGYLNYIHPYRLQMLGEREVRYLTRGTEQDCARRVNRIVTLVPQSFNDCQRIGEAFRSGNPVVMNLTALDRAQAQRVIDFASGLVFGLHGSIQRVTDKVFLLSPRNVDIEVDAAREVAVNAFFNHS